MMTFKKSRKEESVSIAKEESLSEMEVAKEDVIGTESQKKERIKSIFNKRKLSISKAKHKSSSGDTVDSNGTDCESIPMAETEVTTVQVEPVKSPSDDQNENESPVEPMKRRGSIKKTKFKNIFKKKESDKDHVDGSEVNSNDLVEESNKSSLELEVKDQIPMNGDDSATKVESTMESAEDHVLVDEKKRDKFRSLFQKKKITEKAANSEDECPSSHNVQEDTKSDLETPDSVIVEENHKKETPKKWFQTKKKAEKLDNTTGDVQDQIEDVDESVDETEKKPHDHHSGEIQTNRFKSLFQKKKENPKEENEDAAGVKEEETTNNSLDLTMEPAVDNHDVVSKKDKFKNIFSKKKSKVDQPIEDHSADLSTELEESSLLQDPVSESGSDKSEVKVMEDSKKTFSFFSTKKKTEKAPELSVSDTDIGEDKIKEDSITETNLLCENDNSKKSPTKSLFRKKKKKETEQDPLLDISDQSEIIEDNSKTEDVVQIIEEIQKKEKFKLFPKTKKAGNDNQSQTDTREEESCPNDPLSSEKKNKPKSFFTLSKKSKKKEEVQDSEAEVEGEVPVRQSSDNTNQRQVENETISDSADNLAVLPLFAADKIKFTSLSSINLRIKDDEVPVEPRNRTGMEYPAVLLLRPLSNSKSEEVLTTTDSEAVMKGSTHSLGNELTPTAEEVITFPKEGSMDKFKNMFKKKKAHIPLENEEDSIDDTDSVVSTEKTKKRNIFKKKKIQPIEETVAIPSDDKSENDDEWAIVPIKIEDMEKPAKAHKSWSERMRLPTPRPNKKMDPAGKDGARNEDNEMDLPAGEEQMLDESQYAVKLFNETLEPSSTSNITIEEQMQLLCDLFGHESDVIWDSYTPNQKEALKNKLKLVLDPATNSKKRNIEKYVDDMTETIWKQSKYTDGVLNMGIIFVALLNEKELDVRKAKSFSLRPVFRTVKCCNKDNKSTKGCCMIFIDETGRVYPNWQHFITENTYDPSIIVSPSKGIFNTDGDGKVCLEFFTAPSSSVGAKILSITDKTATVTGLGASACFIGGMLTVALLPVAAPAIGIAMAGAGLVGAASAGYSMVRSTQKMKDLSEHEKSLNIKDAEARGHWLSLIGGMTGFVSGVASHGIDILTRSGHHIPAFFRGSIDAINAASIAVNGVGVIDGFSSMFLKWNEEKISTMEIMQLSASLFMFTHSMYNFETANSIIKKHHDITVNEFRDKLGQNQRHHYHKMSKESLKVHGKGHKDVIRSLRAIPDQTEFQKMHMHKADNAITEGMATAAALLVAKFCKKYFVVDENDLTNTIMNAMTLLSDHAFDVFIDVVERFVECKGELVQRSLRGIISVEEVMSDILTSVTSISESLGLDASEFIETLTKTDNFLLALIERIYDMYKDYERVEPNQTCADCKGVYTVAPKGSSSSSSTGGSGGAS